MNQHWLRKNEQSDIIKRLKRENNVTIRRRDEGILKYFTVKGEGLYRCFDCGNSWSSHHSSIRVDLSRSRVFKLYKQRCQHCDYWATPHFTTDRFEEIITKAIHRYKEIKSGNMHSRNQLSGVRGRTQGPHKIEDCERCLKLGRPC